MEKSNSQSKSNEVRAAGVVRIIRRSKSSPGDQSIPCIERTCASCGEAVTLTLEQAGKIPLDQTDCAECFRNLIKEGFEMLNRQRIILSTISQDPVD